MLVFPFDHLMVLVEAVEVPLAGGVPASAAMAPVPLQPEMAWVVALPVRLVQVTVSGGVAEAKLVGTTTAASDAEPASAAQANRRTGRWRFMSPP